MIATAITAAAFFVSPSLCLSFSSPLLFLLHCHHHHPDVLSSHHVPGTAVREAHVPSLILPTAFRFVWVYLTKP